MTSKRALIFRLAIMTLTISGSANPVLTPGVWTDITPPDIYVPGQMTTEGNYYSDIQFDPGNRSTLYTCNVTLRGVRKSTDGGSTWSVLVADSGRQVASAFRMRVDPQNSNRIYLIGGVRGAGFWISNDAGATWTTPAGWDTLMNVIHESDLYNIAVDPTDFNHVLLSFYLGWSPTTWWTDGAAGVAEGFDFGKTWIAHQPIPQFAGDHCYNVAFLFDPASKQGNAQTWIFSNRSTGLWRTTNSGSTWTQVSSTLNVVRSQYYYAKTGVLYGAETNYLMRSTDNGVNWQLITDSNGIPNNYYYAVGGDGELMYTQQTTGGPILVSPESDGLHWTPMKSPAFKTGGDYGANWFNYDSVNQIMYMAAKNSGVWALKVNRAATSINASNSGEAQVHRSRHAMACRLPGDRIALSEPSGKDARHEQLYDVMGKRIRQSLINTNRTGAQIVITTVP
jgi:photosystem II stability/assembly factor-like uncharacterized protein